MKSEIKFFTAKISLMIKGGFRKHHYFIDSKVTKNMMLSNQGKLLKQGVEISGLDKIQVDCPCTHSRVRFYQTLLI